MRKPTIIICGDIMLDHNIYTTIEKLANEAPIPVFNRGCEEYLLGGAGNVLKNMHSIGCEQMYMFSAIGADDNGRRLTELIDSLGVENRTRYISGYTTTTKQRFFCENKLMFRCDAENGAAEKQLLRAVSFADEIEEILRTNRVDCIVLSDYNKGILYKEHCQSIIALANRYGVMTCVDPKNDFTKYIGCTVIKPNRKEAYDLFAVDKSSSIDELHATIYTQVHCRYSIITMAEKGITLYDGTTYYKETPTVHSIVDVTGAGDIVCCILAYFLPLGYPIQKMLKLATDIATKSIEYPGTYTIRPDDIVGPIHKQLSVSQAGDLRRKYADKRIVFTNGCFDLLHRGHMQLFRFCKEKGDVVVVGLNSDESIRRLKGPSRPINAVQTRTDILDAIKYIDHIIVFDDDTPVALLQELRPDYLVKGGDYAVESILGSEYAKETMICNFVDGYSSTGIINKIKSYPLS
jgi:D-beta-D-heptose 7-phosphate kinase/D-beta-D-heptose 1-phosphate adenosyltransferase